MQNIDIQRKVSVILGESHPTGPTIAAVRSRAASVGRREHGTKKQGDTNARDFSPHNALAIAVAAVLLRRFRIKDANLLSDVETSLAGDTYLGGMITKKNIKKLTLRITTMHDYSRAKIKGTSFEISDSGKFSVDVGEPCIIIALAPYAVFFEAE